MRHVVAVILTLGLVACISPAAQERLRKPAPEPEPPANPVAVAEVNLFAGSIGLARAAAFVKALEACNAQDQNVSVISGYETRDDRTHRYELTYECVIDTTPTENPVQLD